MSTNLSSIVSRGLYNTRLIDFTVSGFLPFVKNQIHSSLPNLFLKNALEFFENFDYKIVTTKVIYSKTPKRSGPNSNGWVCHYICAKILNIYFITYYPQNLVFYFARVFLGTRVKTINKLHVSIY